jgi:hypothetical protein
VSDDERAFAANLRELTVEWEAVKCAHPSCEQTFSHNPHATEPGAKFCPEHDRMLQ